MHTPSTSGTTRAPAHASEHAAGLPQAQQFWERLSAEIITHRRQFPLSRSQCFQGRFFRPFLCPRYSRQKNDTKSPAVQGIVPIPQFLRSIISRPAWLALATVAVLEQPPINGTVISCFTRRIAHSPRYSLPPTHAPLQERACSRFKAGNQRSRASSLLAPEPMARARTAKVCCAIVLRLPATHAMLDNHPLSLQAQKNRLNFRPSGCFYWCPGPESNRYDVAIGRF